MTASDYSDTVQGTAHEPAPLEQARFWLDVDGRDDHVDVTERVNDLRRERDEMRRALVEWHASGTGTSFLGAGGEQRRERWMQAVDALKAIAERQIASSPRRPVVPDVPASTPTPDEPEHYPSFDIDEEREIRWSCACGTNGGTGYLTMAMAHAGYVRNHYAKAIADTARAEGEKAERERWTKAAREHAGAWLKFRTPDAKVLADDILMWAAEMQPVNENGFRAFCLTPLDPNAIREGASDAG